MSARAQGGFTLIELIVSFTILGIIATGVTEGIMVGLRTTDMTNQRLQQSTDAQLVASYFTTDVQSADNSGEPAVHGVSKTDSTCGGVAPLVRFRWTDHQTSAIAVVNVASYVFQTVSGEQQLVRRHCLNGSATPTDVETVARSLSATPAVSCQPAACNPLPATVVMGLGGQAQTACTTPSTTAGAAPVLCATTRSN